MGSSIARTPSRARAIPRSSSACSGDVDACPRGEGTERRRVMATKSRRHEEEVSISRPDVERVHRLIAAYIRRTPVVDVDGRDLGIAHARVTLKLEQLQRAGSF